MQLQRLYLGIGESGRRRFLPQAVSVAAVREEQIGKLLLLGFAQARAGQQLGIARLRSRCRIGQVGLGGKGREELGLCGDRVVIQVDDTRLTRLLDARLDEFELDRGQ
ncbi:MAG: hypothetical protein JNM54_11120 [Candidatus Accumulibacter sp.]|uniref:hypothetical protein n=1 Tax=Accumulibacter sp. TaxID=2053492 RepID=UPI001A48F5FB|nr:hypothetical protein [Accumulibacter sp.]MBL8368451.1 hypothetical protein [Accumulibacter sp.]MBN8513393.1 hypothetical protein [Accumulibacter sp.]